MQMRMGLGIRRAVGVPVYANLLIYSQDFDNAAWNKTNLVTAGMADVAVAPDGTTTADQLIEAVTGTAVSHSLFSSPQSIAATSDTDYTMSIYVKAAGRTRVRTWFYGASTGNRQEVIWDLTAGSVAVNNTAGNITNLGAVISPAGNGWYRVAGSLRTGPGETSIRFAVTLSNQTSGTSTSTDYIGDGVSGVLVWGAKLEKSPFATAYVRTTA